MEIGIFPCFSDEKKVHTYACTHSCTHPSQRHTHTQHDFSLCAFLSPACEILNADDGCIFRFVDEVSPALVEVTHKRDFLGGEMRRDGLKRSFVRPGKLVEYLEGLTHRHVRDVPGFHDQPLDATASRATELVDQNSSIRRQYRQHTLHTGSYVLDLSRMQLRSIVYVEAIGKETHGCFLTRLSSRAKMKTCEAAGLPTRARK